LVASPCWCRRRSGAIRIRAICFVFRGRRGDLIKVLWYDGQGLCLFSKRIDRGRFLWPSPADGTVSISTAQLGYLLEGIDWRNPQQTWRPTAAG
jgi:transposase